jgi:hypothetical protein
LRLLAPSRCVSSMRFRILLKLGCDKGLGTWKSITLNRADTGKTMCVQICIVPLEWRELCGTPMADLANLTVDYVVTEGFGAHPISC